MTHRKDVTIEKAREYDKRYRAKNLEKLLKKDRDYQKRLRIENPDAMRKLGRDKHFKSRDVRAKYSKEYYQKVKGTKKYIEYRKEISKRYQMNNKLKSKARTQVHKAIKNGTLIRPPFCSGCLLKAHVEGHHEDYSQPLNVIWLCYPCHRILENIKTIIKRQCLSEIADIEIGKIGLNRKKLATFFENFMVSGKHLSNYEIADALIAYEKVRGKGEIDAS